MPDARPRFCTACGAPLMPGDAFCTACGTRAAEAPSPVVPAAYAPQPTPAPQPAPAAYAPAQAPAPAPTPSGERILAVVGNLTQVGGFMGMKQKTFSLMITDRRLVFAEQSEALWDQMDALEKQIKAEFDDYEGDWRSFVASRDFSSAPWQGYLGQAPAQLLASLGRGFVVPLDEVQSVHLTLRADTDPDFCNSSLLIRGTAQPWDLELPWGNGDEAQRLLSRVVSQVTVEGPEEG